MSQNDNIWNFANSFRGLLDNPSLFTLSYVLYKTDIETLNNCNSMRDLLCSFLRNESISLSKKQYVDSYAIHLDGTIHGEENGKKVFEIVKEFFPILSKNELSSLLLKLFDDFKYEGKITGLSGTPWGVAYLSANILDIQEKDVVTDMCSGIGNFLFCASKNYDASKFFGVEIVPEVKSVCEIVAELNNLDIEIINKDIFELDENFRYTKGFCEAPINLKIDIRDTRYSKYINMGLYKNSADSIFMMCGIDHLAENGTIVFSEQAGFLTSNSHYAMRRFLVDNGYLSAVIQLPKRLLSYSSVSIALIVISKEKHDFVTFVNAESFCTKSRLGRNELSTEDIERICTLLSDETQNSKKVYFEEIREKDYNITPIKYLEDCRIEFGFDVPYEKLGNLCEISRGFQITSSELDEIGSLMETEYQYLGLSSIENNRIPKNLPYITSIEPKAMKYTLKKDDLVLPMAITSPIKCAVANDLNNKTILVASNLYIIRLNTDKILPGFMKALLESEKAHDLLLSFSTGTVMQSLSVELLNDMEIPIPSIEEQQKYLKNYEQIEEEMTALFSRLESLKEMKKTYFEKYLGDR